jgi:hypothetical protein
MRSVESGQDGPTGQWGGPCWSPRDTYVTGGAIPAVEQPLPAPGSGERLHQRDNGLGLVRHSAAVGRDDPFAAATALEGMVIRIPGTCANPMPNTLGVADLADNV